MLLPLLESDLAATTARVADAERRRQLLRDALTRLRLGESEGVVLATLRASKITLAIDERDLVVSEPSEREITAAELDALGEHIAKMMLSPVVPGDVEALADHASRLWHEVERLRSQLARVEGERNERQADLDSVVSLLEGVERECDALRAQLAGVVTTLEEEEE